MPKIALIIFLALTSQTMTLQSAELDEYLKERTAEFDRIPVERRKVLDEISDYAKSRRPVRLTFICTHNSRRSQMSQVWAAIAASHYGVDDVEAYSGGTEQTAFNPRAVAALERAGVKIKRRSDVVDGENPKYEVQLLRSEPIVCFSKVYNESPNPKKDFAAIMTCSEADKNCPNVAGASQRISLPFNDPKASDGTDTEAETYDERCQQIAREMLYVFAGVSGGK